MEIVIYIFAVIGALNIISMPFYFYYRKINKKLDKEIGQLENETHLLKYLISRVEEEKEAIKNEKKQK